MSRTWKKFLSLLLVFSMVLSLGINANAVNDGKVGKTNGSGVELSFEKVDNDTITQRLPHAHEAVEAEEPTYADDESVRVSIVLNGASAIDAGYAPASAGAKTYRDALKAEQQAMAQKISAEVLDGAKLDVVWNLTLAGNIISANVPFGKIEAIRNIIGVKDVVLEMRYLPDAGEKADPENIVATEMTGASEAWNLGYTGAGSTIAIVDTGLDTAHQSFDASAFQYAIDELNETRETPVKLLTNADIAAVWDQLNAAEFIGNVDDTYLNAKVPYAVNYVDKDLDATHDNDTQGEHGSHVAGIAAANKYIPNGNGFDKALETVKTQGEAPDAQLLIMKVFGKGGGAYDSDYMSAIEDAMTIGCDAVNLSLGSSVAGYTTNATYAELLDKLTQFGMVWANSAGNNYSWTNDSTGANYLYADDVNYQTGGSPATYHNSLSVASVDNKGAVGYSFTASDGTPVFYTETNGYGNAPMNTIPGEYTYILIPGPGVDDNNGTNNQFAALGSEILSGKIGICFRGSSSFFVKANAAAAQGAVAAIIANNQAGTISMNLSGYEYSVPAVSITQNDGYLLMQLGEEKEANGVTYYEGTLTVNDELSASNVGTPTDEFQNMSDFSSWGGNGALTMKPEIAAPGGNIWSVWGSNIATSSPQSGHDQYESMSGTSMASPQVAGLTAVLKQYIREANLMDKFPDLTERAVAQSLLMSTAMPLRQEANAGGYWSIMKQGAGLADVNRAITARALIQITDVPASAPASAAASIADGKVKVEVGEVNNGFETSFNVTNFSDEAMSLYLNGEFFTQMISQGAFRTEYTTPVYAGIEWTVNGEAYAPADLACDFNNDGVANGVDAQLLLQWCADPEVEIYNLENADLDGDGNVDTADAKIAFETLNGAGVELAAGETASITAKVSYDMSEYDEFNGNYVEGFLFVREGESNDGALGVEHSIPVFGFNGCFSDATMFDRGSRLEYKYEFGDGEMWYPYMYYADTAAGGLGEDALNEETFLVQYAGDSGAYYFGGNPMIDDESYHPERNALNAGDVLAGVRYTQIRNAGASRFFVTDKYGRTVKGTELTGGASYAAYYYRNQATWQQTSTTAGFNYIPRNVKEGSELTANYQLAIEYNVNADGSVRWDELGEGSKLSIPFVIDNTEPDIVQVVRDTVAAAEPGPSADDVAAEGDAEETAAADTLRVITHDNQYIAAVALFTDEGDLLDAKGAVEDIIRGKEVEYDFDLAEIFGGEEVHPYLLVQVYDYASNLATYKVNFVDDLENAEVESVTVNPEEATIIGTGSIRLSADVRPWGIDDEVTWESDNEEVAVVDENGIVTGVTEGTATITAYSAVNPEVFGTCAVTVKFIDKQLNGIVWDENGEVWFSEFNLKSLPEYTKLHDSSLRLEMTSLAYDENGTLYGSTYDSGDDASSLYIVNPEDWSAEEVGPSSIAYWDICQAPSLGDNHLLAVYGTYVLIVDKTTGDYEGGFNLASYTNNNPLVGIAYEEQYYNTNYGNTDWVFLVDKAGNLYSTGFLPYGGSYSRFGVSKIGNLGYTCDTNYFQSLYYDGASLFWSCFNNSTNKVDMIMIDDLYNDGSIYNAGSFADGVWPVGGLFELGVNPYFGEVAAADHSDAVLDTDAVFMTEIPSQAKPADGLNKNVGGLNVASLKPSADIEKVSTEVVVSVTADELMYNGKIEINFDPTTAKLVSLTAHPNFKGIVDRTNDLGHYVLAWVDLDGIEADGEILTLKFESGSTGTVTIKTYEENLRDGDNDETLPREETVILGSGTTPADHEHAYELKDWTWADDYSSAVATFTCPDDGASMSYDATVEYTTYEGVAAYVATVEVDGETYTDVKYPTASVYGNSLVIGEKFAAKAYLKLTDDLLADTGAYATVNGAKTLLTKANKVKTNGETVYGFDFNLGPKMFNDEINVKVFTSADVPVLLLDKEGNALPEGYTFTAQEYIDKAAASSNAKLATLMKAINDFGHYAQVYSKYNTENLAELKSDISGVTAETVADYEGKVLSNEESVIKYVGSSMVLSDNLSIRQYFKLGDGVKLKSLTFTINGKKVTPVSKSGQVYVATKNVPIKNFDQPYTFEVKDATGAVVYSGEYSVLSYVQSALTKSTDENLINLTKSMVVCNQAAKDYFAK